eukprot:m.179538 g.179538  ORF g.179538 m.179538 type:complete len:739 (-) comp24543_c1_seq2:2423-4639(-)
MNQTGERRRTRSTDIASPGTLSPPPPSKWTPSLPQATTAMATVPGRTPLEEGGRGGGRTQTTRVHRARERRRTPWLWQQLHSIPLIERLLYVIGFSLITFALICATMLPALETSSTLAAVTEDPRGLDEAEASETPVGSERDAQRLEAVASRWCPLPALDPHIRRSTKAPTSPPAAPATFQTFALIDETEEATRDSDAKQWRRYANHAALRVNCSDSRPHITFHDFVNDATLKGRKRAVAVPRTLERGSDGWFRTEITHDYARVECGEQRAVVWRNANPTRLDRHYHTAYRAWKMEEVEDADPSAETVVLISLSGVGRETFESEYPRSSALLRGLQSGRPKVGVPLPDAPAAYWGAEFRRHIALMHDSATSNTALLAGCEPFRHGVDHCNEETAQHIEVAYRQAGFSTMVFDPLLSEASKSHSWRRPGDFDNFAEALLWANGNADCNPLAAPDCAQTAVNVALQLAALDVASDYLHAPPTVGSTGRLVVVGVGSLATTAARGPVPVEVDVALAAFLRDVTTTEVLGDAVVLVTSDGGAARSGMTVGQRAHTHVPLLWVLLPKVTVESNIELAQIVYDNGAAVVSGLDVYATLVYIAHGFDVRTIYPLHDAVGVGVWAWVCLRRVCMGGCASGGVGKRVLRPPFTSLPKLSCAAHVEAEHWIAPTAVLPNRIEGKGMRSAAVHARCLPVRVARVPEGGTVRCRLARGARFSTTSRSYHHRLCCHSECCHCNERGGRTRR